MEIVFAILVLIFSVVLHEVSHGFIAYYLGDPTAKHAGRLTLNPMKHLDPIGSFLVPFMTYALGGFIFGWAKPVPYNPYNLRHRHGDALVAAAGPAVNLLVVAVFSSVIRLAGAGLPVKFVELSAYVVLINLILAIFNLLPVPPLDGSKILFSLLPYRQRQIEEWLTRYQFILILAVLLVFWRWLLAFVYFLFQAATGLAF